MVCTHTDKAHIHNHIIWNSTTLDNKRKFRNFRDSSRAIARLSDLICIEHQLSVIKNPNRGSTAYNKWHGFKGKQAHRDILRIAIDEALEQKPHDFDAFLSLLAAEGFRVKHGKHLTFVHADFKQNIRMSTLGEEYCEDAIRAIIKGQRTHSPMKKAVALYKGTVFENADGEMWIKPIATKYRLQYIGIVNELLATLDEAGEFTGLRQHAARAVELTPENIRAHYWLLHAMNHLGTLELARNHIAHAKEILTSDEYASLKKSVAQDSTMPFAVLFSDG